MTAASPRAPFVVAAPLAAVTALALAACGDLKAATPEDAGTEEVDAAPEAASSANTGPGPHGSLPSGYCCTKDSECRYRHCADTGAGGKMCLDECARDLFCTRPDITFTCDTAASPRYCQPSPGFACIPAARFVRGTSPIGACCNGAVAPNNDGTAGFACEGANCAATGDSPLVCTHRCEFQSDCPGGFQCAQFGASKACVRSMSGYTCQ